MALELAVEPVAARARHLLGRAIDFVLPPRCLGCGVVVDRIGAVCPACWSRLRFIAAPYCEVCGRPFEVEVRGALRCGPCLAAPPAYGRGRAALVYDDDCRGMILKFKHGDRIDAARAFGPWMARAGAELLGSADLIVPVPLHRWRLWRRRYNQAALLAQAIGRASGVPVLVDAVVRSRATPSQEGLTRNARARNVAGAFQVPDRRRPRVAGRRVIVVDDVLTTGATAGACAKALRRAGAADVAVLALARVP